MKRIISLLLSLMMLLSCASALAMEAQELPDAEDMFIDYDDYYGQVLHGYYNYDCYVSEGNYRTAKFYIPENTVYNQPTVFIMVPAGQDTWEFFVNSGWKDACDKYVFHAVLAETAEEQGEWDTIEEEMEYLSALRDDVSYRPFFVSFSASFYAIAYGNAADVLLKHAMANPNQWASVACIGVTGVEDEFIAQLQQTVSREEDKMLSEVPMPIFLVAEEKTEAVQKLIDYYKAANATEDVQYSCAYADEVYIPAPWVNKESMDNEPVAKVLYATAPIEKYYEADTINNVYNDFLGNYYRYPGMGNGALRATADIDKLGFVKFEAKVPGGFAEDGSDLYNREWFVYVPDSVNPDEPAPVVFDFHGAGGTGNEIAGRTGWVKTANDRGCILVCPTGSHTLSIRNVSDMTTNELFRAMWNTGGASEGRPDDRIFVRWLVDWVKENYNVDAGRVYATGQSSGGAMSCACAYFLSDIFTAAAPVSAGGAPAEGAVVLENPIPVLCMKGTKDGGGLAGSNGTGSKALCDYWTARYNTTKTWDDFSWGNSDNCSYVAGVFRNYVFKTTSGVPMFRMVDVIGKTHAYLPSEAYMIWDEFFATYHKDADGNLYYMNTLVELN